MRTWSLKRLLSLSWELDVEATKSRMLSALRLVRPAEVLAAADAGIIHAGSSSLMQCVRWISKLPYAALLSGRQRSRPRETIRLSGSCSCVWHGEHDHNTACLHPFSSMWEA